MADGFIHWDNPYEIICPADAAVSRASVVTIYDHHPPKTRILQVDRYSVPSETKMIVGKTVTVYAGDTEVDWIKPDTFLTPVWDGYSFRVATYPPAFATTDKGSPDWPSTDAAWARGLLYSPALQGEYKDYLDNVYLYWHPDTRITLRYAGPYSDDAQRPAFPGSGESWDDTEWKSAEVDAIDLDRNAQPGMPGSAGKGPKWQINNWVTGGDLSDGKYFIAVTATDDVHHTTGEPYPGADGSFVQVQPDVVQIWIDNKGPEDVKLSAADLKSDGTLAAISNGEMERGQALVLYVGDNPDNPWRIQDLDSVTFQFKAKHDYDWTTIQVKQDGAWVDAVINTYPYSVTLSPLSAWSGVTGEPQNIALGNVYQFRAVAQDKIGNKSYAELELTVVDKEADAHVALITRLDGQNNDEKVLLPRMFVDYIPRLTGRVGLTGFTDADVVGVTYLFRAEGSDVWTPMEAMLNVTDWSSDGFDNDGDGFVDEPGEGSPWNTAEWLTDGIDNDNDGQIDEPGECGYHYEGQQEWYLVWDTTTLPDGVYEVAVVANTGDGISAGVDDQNRVISVAADNILKVYVDHNSTDITAAISDSSPKSGEAVGGWTRRPVTSQNAILDPDDKNGCSSRGEVDLYVTFADGLPSDLDMGVSTGVVRDNNNVNDDANCESCGQQTTDEFDENLLPNGSALKPSVTFEYKESSYPDVGNENVDDSSYWKPIKCAVAKQPAQNGNGCDTVFGEAGQCIVYDAYTKRISAVWSTVADNILNGYYDIRVRVVDEAGNVSYKVIARNVIVDNTPPGGNPITGIAWYSGRATVT